MTKKSGIGTLITEEHELGTSALDLFSVPPVERTQRQGQEHNIFLSHPLTNEGPYEFLIPGNATDFVMLDKTALYGEVEILGPANVKVKDTNLGVSVVNNFPQALFKQVEISLNGVCVSDLSTPTYPYKAYLENHLSYGRDIKETTLLAKEMYVQDEPGKEGDTMTDLADFKGTDGVTKRAIMIRNKICFNMKLHLDMLGSTRHLIPGVDIKIKLIRGDDKFAMLSTDASFKINLKLLQLKIRRISVAPEIVSEIENGLLTEPVKYPIALSRLKAHSIASGTTSFQVQSIMRGKLPRSFIFGFLEADAFEGSYTKNPFMFKHFNLSLMNVHINGVPVHSMPITPKWENTECVDEYSRFLDNIGLHQNHTNGITLEDFKSNTVLFCYDLSPDLCNSFYKHAVEEGNVDISVSFASATTKNIVLLLYSTYDELVLIDKDRNVAIST